MRKAGTGITSITPLNVPVPPMLATAIGYSEDARFVSFQWTPYGDEVEYSDGRVTATGNWEAFLAFIQHPAVYPYLQDYDLGSSEAEAKYALLLDREEPALYIAPVKEAKDFLSHQKWPTQQPVGMTQEEYSAFVNKALKNMRQRDISMKEVERRIAEYHALIKEMEQWLDKQLTNN
jgi:hypothetical protein